MPKMDWIYQYKLDNFYG